MSVDLSELPDGWGIFHREEGEWSVWQCYERLDGWTVEVNELATAGTVEQAIRLAKQTFAEREQVEAERAADYVRRNAAGDLTEGEKFAQRIGAEFKAAAIEAALNSPFFARRDA